MSDAPERIRLSFMGGQLVQTLDPTEGDIEYVRADIARDAYEWLDAETRTLQSALARIAELEERMAHIRELLAERYPEDDSDWMFNLRAEAGGPR